MKQCESCINKEYKDDLLCCRLNELSNAWTELHRQIPVFGKHIEEHECASYIESD